MPHAPDGAGQSVAVPPGPLAAHTAPARTAVEVDRLTHTYPRLRPPPRLFARTSTGTKNAAPGLPAPALDGVSFGVNPGEMFCLLGPNGSGKSTLFRILSTLMRPDSGGVRVFGADLFADLAASRRTIGVVFQRPSLDLKLTSRENLDCQGSLYGLHGAELSARIEEVLGQFGIAPRAGDPVERLSGGMQRRVELAKAMLHKPRLLVLDEPSTGLDPGARKDFDSYLRELCSRDGVTVLLTTHILDEADLCDTLGILDLGRLVALGSPADLKAGIGGDVISVTTPDAAGVARLIRTAFGGDPQVVGSAVRIERTAGHEFIPELVRALPGRIEAVSYSKPTLEDVFIRRTGRRFLDSYGNEG